MKGAIITACLVTTVLGGGVWWSLRRQPSTAPLDDQASAFTVVASGAGQLLTFQNPQTPLRAFRWLPPLPDGVLAAQVLSQNDRQRVAWFHDGQQDTLLVQKPVGVADGFWRFAALRQVTMAPGGTMLLLYQAGDPESTEASLALALDVAGQQVLWSCRGGFSQLALGQGPAPAVYLWGGTSPILRLALKPGSPHPVPEAIALPAEIPEVDDLLPTGKGFLVSHRNGLSRYSAGWTHQPCPEADGPACQGWKSSLTRDGHAIWWQPLPGKLMKVLPDGSPGEPLEWQLPPEDPFGRDARLLRVLGSDPDGWLWFSLASPVPAAQPPVPPEPRIKAHDTEAIPGAAEPGPALDWGPYVAAGLDRLYRWLPARNTLERVDLKQAWPGLNPPAPVQLPALGPLVVPAAGSLLAEGPRCAWWLPLKALPFQRVVQAM